MFAPLAVGDEVGDRDDPQILLGGELAQFRELLGIAVVVDDLGEHPDRGQTRRVGQVNRRLRMAGAHQYSALARYEGKHMAGSGKVIGPRVVARQCLDGVGTFVCGDARRKSDLVVDGYRVGGGERRLVARHHRVEVKALGMFLGDGRTQQAAGVADHETDLVRRRLGGGHDEVALVLAVVVVDDHHEFTSRDGRDGVFDGVEISGHVVRLPAPSLVEGRGSCPKCRLGKLYQPV